MAIDVATVRKVASSPGSASRRAPEALAGELSGILAGSNS